MMYINYELVKYIDLTEFHGKEGNVYNIIIMFDKDNNIVKGFCSENDRDRYYNAFISPYFNGFSLGI